MQDDSCPITRSSLQKLAELHRLGVPSLRPAAMGVEKRRPPLVVKQDRRHYVCCAFAALLLVGASWWQGSHAQLPHIINEACDARCAVQSNGTLASALDDASAKTQRICAEKLYRCNQATLVFVHVHKGGGTTLVDMARKNKAGLARVNRNGDPELQGRRVPWWTMAAPAQKRWFASLRAQDVRFVATEKGFPSASNLLAPYPSKLVYAIVVREPSKRFVSYYFWKWRRKDWQAVASKRIRGNARVAEVAPDAPSFGEFFERETPLDAYYVRRLLGLGETGGTVDELALERAKAVLRRTFSLVLLTERLGDFGPLVQRTLGWAASDFDAFRAKANPAPDTKLLEAWRSDWSAEIARRMPLDGAFYAYAAELAEARLRG